MDKPVLVITPDDSRDRNGPVTLTEEGAVRRVPFDGGRAFYMEEGTTNMVPNPNANVSTSAWTALGSPTLTRDTSETIVGEQSVRIDADGSATYQGIIVNTVGGVVEAGQVWTASAWLKGSAGLALRILLREDSGGALTAQRVDTTGEWQRISVTRTLTAPSSYVHLRIDNAHSLSTAYTAWVSGLQIEQKPYATTYADGSLGEGYSWSGTPDNSPSVRADAQVYATHPMPPERGSMYIRYKIDYLNGITSGDHGQAIGGFGQIGGGSSRGLTAQVRSGNQLQLRQTSMYNSGRTVSAPTDTLGLYLAYTPDTVSADWLDGGPIQTEVRDGYPPEGEETFRNDRIHVGYSGSAILPLPLNGYVAAVIVYDRLLTEAEITRLDAMPTNRLRLLLADYIVPVIRSGITIAETKIYESDMFGVSGREISGDVISCKVTSDIDRAGSKNRVDMKVTSATHGGLAPASWVTVYQEIAKEYEGLRREQIGTFELGQPSVERVGTRYEIDNSGSDIVDLLSRSGLLDTFYTPVGGLIMPDVELAIRMLGITSMGQNLVSNGGFEDGFTGWSTPVFELGAAGYREDTIPQFGGVMPEGEKAYAVYLTNGLPIGARVFTYQDFTLPVSVKRMFVSAMGYRFTANETLECRVQFYNASGTQMTRLEVHWSDGTNDVSRWKRNVGTIDVPEGAVTVRVYLWVHRVGAGSSSRSAFDDVQVRAITGDLLPASVLALPPSTGSATSRIQHITSDTRLKAVNDRLAALGLMAVNARPDSKFTSRPSRDIERDDPARTYRIHDDIRIADGIKTTRTASNQYNRVFAIKEDFATGTSMVAIAENDDVDDPWSIHNMLLEPKLITVQDAEQLSVLQAIADAEIAKASIQEAVTFSISPDPGLSIYDIIEIVGPDPTSPIIGRWAIESMETDMTAGAQLTTIGARRTKARG